jgi:hypothetical protein
MKASEIIIKLAVASVLSCAAIACAPRSGVSGVPAVSAADVRSPIASNARFALRIPRGAERVVATGPGGEWGKFEQGLFASGLVMVDQALMQELLASNPSPSYEQIRARTGADVLIDVGEAKLEFRRLDPSDAPYELYCEVITISAKLVDVASGTMLGSVDQTTSSCPEASYAREYDYGFIVGASGKHLNCTSDEYKECPAPAPGYVSSVYSVDGEPRRWSAAGKELGATLLAKMTGEPVAAVQPQPAAAPGEPPAPPAASPAAPAAPPAKASAGGSLEDRLAKLRDMLKNGVITQREHDDMRKKVLSEY